MDTSTLHAVTEELAALLSEVTRGDLGHRTPRGSGDVGALYVHLIDQNIRVAAAVAGETDSGSHRIHPTDRAALGVSLDLDGGGLEVGYRQTAQLMETAFASVTAGDRLCRVDGFEEDVEVAALYEMQLSDAVIHTWDLAQALGLPFLPASEVAWRVLREMLSGRGDPRGKSAACLDGSAVLHAVLRLSARAS